jgi:RNA polymerase sigma-70 factor (ECF subfamily)
MCTATGCSARSTTPTRRCRSALQRARATLATPGPDRAPHAPLSEDEQRVLGRFVDAWQRCDFPAIAALLREDAILTMPPEPITINGREQIVHFLATVPAEGRLDLIRLVATRANGQPALAAYLPDELSHCRGYGIMVFTVAGEGIATITGFPSPELFERFGLPAVWE